MTGQSANGERKKPVMPKPGTDNARMLNELLRVYPGVAWNLNSRLGITSNSRASNLRELNWPVEAVRGEHIPGTRKHHWGYRLTNLGATTADQATDEHGSPVLFVCDAGAA